MVEANEHTHYLGLPNIVGRQKNITFGFLKDRVRKWIQSWNSSLLSRASKEILIKLVVQSLPSYAMSVFLLPEGVCRDMERFMSQFRWQTSSITRKGIHWKSWSKLTLHKNKGGLGFRNLRDFNLAMLAKQGWRLLTRPNSLVGIFFSARYYSRGSFLDASLGSNPSFIWRSVLGLKIWFEGELGRGEIYLFYISHGFLMTATLCM